MKNRTFMYALYRFVQNYQTRISAVFAVWPHQSNTSSYFLILHKGTWKFATIFLYTLSIRTVDPVDGGYKEGSDRTLLGPYQASAEFGVAL